VAREKTARISVGIRQWRACSARLATGDFKTGIALPTPAVRAALKAATINASGYRPGWATGMAKFGPVARSRWIPNRPQLPPERQAGGPGFWGRGPPKTVCCTGPISGRGTPGRCGWGRLSAACGRISKTAGEPGHPKPGGRILPKAGLRVTGQPAPMGPTPFSAHASA